VTEDWISDRSKADGFAKAISCAQAGWILFECIGRAKQGLPISTLEVTTVSYVACTFLMYTYWWYKPLNVSTVVEISEVSRLDVEEVCKGEDPGVTMDWRNDVFGRRNESLNFTFNQFVSILFGSLVFCGLHCWGWNFCFPTFLEQFFWQVCSVGSVLVSAILFRNHVSGLFRLPQQWMDEMIPSKHEVQEVLPPSFHLKTPDRFLGVCIQILMYLVRFSATLTR
jgi:hypothetical protein